MRSHRVLLGSAVILPLVALPAQGEGQRGQYKRVHQQILKPLLNGKPDVAATRLTAALRSDGGDPETWFVKTVLDAARGDKPGAVAAMRKALELGLPAGRFLAGPRTLLAPIADTEAFLALRREHATTPVHGPMLGSLTDTAVKVWLRTATAAPVRVSASPKGGGDAVVASGATAEAADFTTVIDLRGLRPETEYTYTVRIGDGPERPGGRFSTIPPAATGGVLRVAFGGGAGYVPVNERMWTTIGKLKPHLLLLLGDNVYSDAPTLRDMQRYCYYRRQSRPEFRALVRDTAVLSIWDDHDFGTNDCFYGADIDKPAFKREVYEVFCQNWANPAYGTAKIPGCFYVHATPDVGFVMLDGRYYRENPKGKPRPSMLGPGQLNWARDALQKRTEVFKLLCSPVPWTFASKGNSLDTWNGFKAERDLLFDMLTGMRATGVILLSADRHRTDIWKIPRQLTEARIEPYPLLELNSSRLTNQHVHPTMRAAEFSYNKKQSFGYLELDTRSETPEARFEVVDIDGEVVHTRRIPYSELSFK